MCFKENISIYKNNSNYNILESLHYLIKLDITTKENYEELNYHSLG